MAIPGCHCPERPPSVSQQRPMLKPGCLLYLTQRAQHIKYEHRDETKGPQPQAGQTNENHIQLIGKGFQGHKAAQFLVLGFIDDSHAAAAEPFDDLITGNPGSNHELSGDLSASAVYAHGTKRAKERSTAVCWGPPACHAGTGGKYPVCPKE